MLKRFKFLYQLYNLFQWRRLKYLMPLYKKYGIAKKYFSSISYKDFEGISFEPNKFDRKDSAQEMKKDPFFQTLSESYQKALSNWSKDGYAVLPSFFSKKQVERINREIDHLIQSKKVAFRYKGKKVMFAFEKSELIRSMARYPKLIQILSYLLDREVELFQSINFIYPSEQRTHSDFVHMTTFPPNNMIAVWIALEDISMDNGPLHYYPGSHRLPFIMNEDFGNQGNQLFLGNKGYAAYEDEVESRIDNQQLKKEVFLAKKGDILIWHANLLHGGEPSKSPELTRKSMVFHYFAKDVIRFHEITQRPSYSN